MSGRRFLERIACLVIVLVVSTGAFARPHFDAAGAIVPTSVDNIVGEFASDTLLITSSSQWGLEDIGRQFNEPIDPLPALRNPADTDSPVLLPAVPSAISMTLCGFLCVSFVRDRRVWLGVACFFLWLVQAGIQAVPQLGHKLCWRMEAANHSTEKLNPALAANSFERTGNHDTIRYIGLLRSLEGIPDHNLRSLQQDTLCNFSLAQKRKSRNDNRRFALLATGNYDTGSRQSSVHKNSIPPQAFTAQTNWPQRLIVCPAGTAGNFIIFSPAFIIFSNLARGPPPLGMKN